MSYIHHLLGQYPHLLFWFTHHHGMWRHFRTVARAHPHRIHHLLTERHYRHWLLGYMRTYHRLPGIDLLLGA